MANIPNAIADKLAMLNKFIGLCLQGCKRYKGKGVVHLWTKQALHYLMQARQYLKSGLFELYRWAIDTAKRRIQWANHELTISKVSF